MSTILGMKFADAPSLYSKEQLDTDLATGVGKVVAGIGSDYRLNVDTTNAFISLSHKDSVFNGTAAAGSVKPAIGISAAGIAMGYNRASDGAWVDSVAIDSSGNASFSGSINATSGNFTGTITAGSIITNSVTVDGTALSTIKSGAAAGASAVQPAALTAALNTKLDNAAATIMASGFYLKSLYYDSTTAGTGGVAIFNGGILGRRRNAGNTGWETTMSIGTDGNLVVKGDISGSTGTFAGTVSASNLTSGTITATVSINSAGSVNATGLFGSALGNVAIVGAPSSIGHGVAGIANGAGTAGLFGKSSNASGYGIWAENSGASGVGLAAGGSGVDVLLADSEKIAFGGQARYIRYSSGTFRMADAYSTDAYMLMVGSATTASSTGATLAARIGSTNAQSGWLTCKVNGSTIHIPFWA